MKRLFPILLLLLLALPLTGCQPAEAPTESTQASAHTPKGIPFRRMPKPTQDALKAAGYTERKWDALSLLEQTTILAALRLSQQATEPSQTP